MSSGLRKLASDTALYGISTIVGRLLNYLLVPLYTYTLAPAEYGVITELYAYSAFFMVLYQMGMDTAWFRFASRKPEDSQDFYSQALILVFLVSIGLTAFVFWQADILVAWLDLGAQVVWFVRWLALTLAIDALLSLPFAQMRLLGQARRFAGLRIFNILINISLNLIFLLALPSVDVHILPDDAKVGYVFLSGLLANGCLLLVVLSDFRHISLVPRPLLIWSMLVYGLPLMLTGLSAMANEMLGRLMLKNWLPVGFYGTQSSQDALGIYGACYKLSIFMQLVVQAFRYAAEPFFFSKAKDKNAPESFAKLMHWFVICSCVVLLGISLNLSWIGPLVLRQSVYLMGLSTVPILLLANLFLGVYYNLSVWYKLTDKTIYAIWLSLAGVGLTVLLNFLLIPWQGYMGSALANLGCYFVMCLLCYWLGQRFYPIPYQSASALSYISLSFVLILIGNQYLDQKDPYFIVYANLVFVGFVGLVGVKERGNLRG